MLGSSAPMWPIAAQAPRSTIRLRRHSPARGAGSADRNLRNGSRKASSSSVIQGER